MANAAYEIWFVSRKVGVPLEDLRSCALAYAKLGNTELVIGPPYGLDCFAGFASAVKAVGRRRLSGTLRSREGPYRHRNPLRTTMRSRPGRPGSFAVR